MAILNALRTRWFLAALAVLIPSGLVLGMRLPADVVESLLPSFRPRVITATVLFLMAFSLDNRQLRASLRAPGPVVWASFVNYAMIPFAAVYVRHWQLTEDFSVGLMISASVPCTMAAASVWTRRAGGNDAVSLLVTFFTNAACFVMTPMWLAYSIGASGEIDELRFESLSMRLLQAVLIPSVLAQLVRLAPRATEFANQHTKPMGVVAQSLILTLVFSSSIRSGAQLVVDGPRPDLISIAVVWACCIGLHVGALAAAVLGGRCFGFSRPDLAAVAFAGSQKTLPIGILISDVYGQLMGVPFAVFPILMYHASQLFIDTLIADYFSGRKRGS